jgi:hypothetical protein
MLDVSDVDDGLHQQGQILEEKMTCLSVIVNGKLQ